VYGSLAALAVAGGAVAFAVGGPWALLGFGAAAVVAPGAARRIVKGPAKKSTGGMAALLKAAAGRPKNSKTKGLGSMAWPFTGNQSRRALSKGASGRSPGAGRSGRKALPKLAGGRAGALPAITARGRAKQAAAAGKGASSTRKALPKATASRPVPKTGATRPGAKPTTPKATAAKKPAARPAAPSRTPRSTSPGARPRLTAGAPRHGQRTGLPKLGKLTRPMSRPAAPKAGSRRGVVSPVSRSPRSGTGARGRVLPKLGRGTGPKVGAGKGHPQATRRKGHLSLIPGGLGGARKLGTGRPGAAAKRLATGKRVPSRVAKRVPNRTVRRPNPRRATVPQLIRTGLGIPRRNGLRLVRAKAAARRQARRTLLRALIQRGRNTVTRFTRWNWRSLRAWLKGLDEKSRGLTAPGPLPKIVYPATPPRTEPRRERRQPIPELVGRRATTKKETATMSTPNDSIVEAFAALANFDPENATEMEQFVRSLAELHTEIGNSFNTLATSWQDEQPVDPAVTELIQNIASCYVGLADLSDETHQTFRTAHADQLANIEDPQKNAHKWDVTQNR
jgi:hypothetical protein